MSPAAGAQVAQPFTFDWSDVARGRWYVIEVDDASSFTAPLVLAATTTPSPLAVNSLPNGALFWRVRAFNADGVGGPYSAVRTVRVGSTARRRPARCRTLAAEPGRATRASHPGSDRLRLERRRRRGTYTIQIDDSESFSAPLTVGEHRRVLAARHELAAEAADVVARARQRRLRRPGGMVGARDGSR